MGRAGINEWLHRLPLRVTARLKTERYRWLVRRYRLREQPNLPGNETAVTCLPEIEKVGPEGLPRKFDDSIIGSVFIRRPLGSPRFVLSARGGRSFFCSHFFVLDRRKFLYDVGIDNALLLDERNVAILVESCRGRRIARLQGTVCYASNTSVDNYYHWMLATLPMIHYCRLAGHHIDHIYINAKTLPSFAMTSLERAGINASAIVNEPCSGDINVMTVNDWRYALRPESYSFVRSLYGDALKVDTARPRWIFVDRGPTAKYRFLRNSDEIATMLNERYGAIRVIMDNLSVVEQANIFHNAEVVVAAHGAALTNLVFCRPGAKVFDLLSPNFLTNELGELARATGLHHTPIVGEVDEHLRMRPEMSIEGKITSRGADFTVPIDKIIAAIDVAVS
jgi:Glycosyltransferase 61